METAQERRLRARGRTRRRKTVPLRKKYDDIRFEGHGSVALIRPLTERGTEWLDENIGEVEPWAMIGDAIACETRYVEPIIEGAVADRLGVSVA
jgi:hypothetical protein